MSNLTPEKISASQKNEEGLTTQDAPATYAERYGLVMAICMIVGICVGSGIFFKVDNVLIATGGNVMQGVIMFVIAALATIFGSLTMSLFSERSVCAGGVAAYIRECVPERVATVFAWNFTLLYLVPIAGVLCWVVGVYVCMVAGLEGTLTQQALIGLMFLVGCTVWNVCWPRFSGWLQNVSTFLKMIPLIVVAVIGIGGWILSGGTMHTPSAPEAQTMVSGGGSLAWLAAAAPIAFSYDGWPIATSIAPEVRNARRNLPLALTLAPLVVLALYLGYFLGLSLYLGPEAVIAYGDASPSVLFERLLGPTAAVLPMILATLAVAGTANGVILATLRLPYALAVTKDIPFYKQIGYMHPRLRFPLVSALVAFVMMVVMYAIHIGVTAVGFIPNGDISEISVLFNMLMLLMIYVGAIRLWRRGGVGVFRGLIAPIIAIAVSLFVGLSGIVTPGRLPVAVAYAAILAIVYLCLRVRDARRSEA